MRGALFVLILAGLAGPAAAGVDLDEATAVPICFDERGLSMRPCDCELCPREAGRVCAPESPTPREAAAAAAERLPPKAAGALASDAMDALPGGVADEPLVHGCATLWTVPVPQPVKDALTRSS